MGLFSKLFGTKKQTGLPGLLNLHAESTALTVAFPEVFCEHFNSIAPEMMGEFSDSESLHALSDFAILIIKIKILCTICSNHSEKMQKDVEKVTGMHVACASSQIKVINRYLEPLTDNIQTSKLQAYVKSQIDGCAATINFIISMTHDLGLESYVLYNTDSLLNVLEEQKTKDYIVNMIQSIIKNQRI